MFKLALALPKRESHSSVSESSMVVPARGTEEQYEGTISSSSRSRASVRWVVDVLDKANEADEADEATEG